MAGMGPLQGHEAAMNVVSTVSAPVVSQESGLLWRTAIVVIELSCLFTVLYQQQLHFGTRAGLLGSTTGQRRFSHSIPY